MLLVTYVVLDRCAGFIYNKMWECGESIYVSSARKASDSDLGWSVVGLHCFTFFFFGIFFLFLENKCIITSQVRLIARQWSLARRYKSRKYPKSLHEDLSEIWERFLLRVVRAEVMEKRARLVRKRDDLFFRWNEWCVLLINRRTNLTGVPQENRMIGDDVKVIKG